MPEELKPELLPCPLCASMSFGIFAERRIWICECLICHVRVARPTRAEAIAAWNTRPVSELERLAREVVRFRQEMIDLPNDQANLRVVALLVFDRSIDALAAYLAEPSQKGKQE